ncbi:MAG: hypothetical protein C0456_06255 [Hyphomonas sp.]|uniref:hypothetical protein n=1 Tax=Hyphomonas sp. TaxID=87 RepID=UPI001D73A777|nr:hypothetical protein [Hyphomonas sp.]MBA4226218.1 hypothetical protein [Hyphomonas sp.]
MQQQQQNGEGAFVLAIVAFIGVVIVSIFMIIAALAAFMALILTIMCIIAWNEPLTIGSMTITPEEARAFIARGILGAILAPTFTYFCLLLFQSDTQVDYWGYVVLGGYVMGSLVVECVIQEAREKAQAEAQQVLPPLMQPPATRQEPPRRPFEYASWDDEDER